MKKQRHAAIPPLLTGYLSNHKPAIAIAIASCDDRPGRGSGHSVNFCVFEGNFAFFRTFRDQKHEKLEFDEFAVDSRPRSSLLGPHSLTRGPTAWLGTPQLS